MGAAQAGAKPETASTAMTLDDNLNIALPTDFVLDDRYVIEGVLGDGGFGIVYRAWDRTFETRVAIKEFLPREVSTRGSDAVSVVPRSKRDARVHAEGVEAFLEEARRIHRLDHENVVEVTNYVHAHGTGYLVMPYYNGETLSQFLERGETLSGEEMADLTDQVLSALRYVHGRDLLHRDISPGNLFLKQDGSVLLIDFGASRQVVGERSHSLSAIVKPGYAPLEQYHATGNQGPWTDLYALGATMYRCVTGEPPPVATERVDAVNDSRPDPVLRLAGSEYRDRFPPAMLSLIDRLLALRAPARPQSVKSVRKLMPPAARRTGPRPRRPAPPERPSARGPPERPPRTRGRRFARAAVAAVAVLAVVGVALFAGTYYMTFGDNLSLRADNGECSDPAFTGPGMAEEVLLDDHRHDAADCFSLYSAGRVDFRPYTGATLTVSSTPGSALVWMNGTYVGATPVVTEVDPGGIYSVDAILDGFAVQTRQVEIEQMPATLEAWDRSLHFELAPVAAEAAVLVVQSNVEDGALFIDGRPAGSTGPERHELGAGDHVVGVTREYYADWSRSVTLGPGEEHTLFAELVPIPDSCQYANDNECDEPFLCPIGTDTTDCAVDPRNSCRFAFDDECDEPRLCAIGTDTADCSVIDPSNSCMSAFDGVCGEPDGCAVGTDTADCDAFFGDDSSDWANNGECDDPRFQGQRMASVLIEQDRGRDATDCRSLFNAGLISER